MYFPVVHSGQFDLIALRESAVEIRSSGKIIPVIIPVATNASGLSTLLRRYSRSGQPFCLVVNPVCCPKTMARARLDAAAARQAATPGSELAFAALTA